MKFLIGERIKLMKFTERSITPEYVSWLNDPEVNRYLEIGRFPITAQDLCIPKDEKNMMFMIMSNFFIDELGSEIKDNDFHKYIGTCSIHKIDWISRRAEIGYMIGNKQYWNKGVATELISLLTNYCFNRLNLNKITAGVVDENVSSSKALEKNGYKQFAVYEQEYYLEGKFLNAYRFHNFQVWYNGYKS